MKNLIAELLLKLAQKEEESKELVAQVEALEIIVTAMLRNMAQNEQEMLIRQVEDFYCRVVFLPVTARLI